MISSLNNVPVYSVSQISSEVKRTLEDRFERVRIRGEVSRTTQARSGHFYLALKDDRAVIDAVAWRGIAHHFPFEIAEGMELIATGKLTSYPGQSKYQLIVEHVELAGEGALLKLLEERKQALRKEGLFREDLKQQLPLLPRNIGVVSSPNGAVIRDIWHRVSDRFPLPIKLWPVLVQGRGAAEQIANAIDGFSNLPDHERPDVLIVARGGGSLEDLWAFNEEIVIRAAIRCQIPLISAIGHETDTTLLDYVADRRAPTPTAAAEFAVPVRSDLLNETNDSGYRLQRALQILFTQSKQGLDDLSRALSDPKALLNRSVQDLDLLTGNIDQTIHNYLRQIRLRISEAAASIKHPEVSLRSKLALLNSLDTQSRLQQGLGRYIKHAAAEVETLFNSIHARHSAREALRAQGWVTVKGSNGKTLISATQIKPGHEFKLDFLDGVANVLGAGNERSQKKPKSLDSAVSEQDTLF